MNMWFVLCKSLKHLSFVKKGFLVLTLAGCVVLWFGRFSFSTKVIGYLSLVSFVFLILVGGWGAFRQSLNDEEDMILRKAMDILQKKKGSDWWHCK